MGIQRRAPGVDAATDRFERLFRRHHGAVVAYVRRRAPAEAVDDVVGETFLVAWRRLDDVPVQELPWLLAVARNVLATQRRGAGRRRALALRLGSVTGFGAAESEASFSVDGVDSRLLAALAMLSEKDREALTLTAWDGLDPHEAAVVLGESSGSFRVRLHRARKRLRRLLDEHPPLAPPRSEQHRLRVGENQS
ncbi:MAG TPA: sigma-70 family RNA polymerase sigma factor [Solirubrobacteraceae bacterium]|nr:sigma-70 family RNA polymerase sigma factor [Solirubrobacteraceae bacterium]